MKRIPLVCCLVVLIFSVVACKSGADIVPSNDNDSQERAATESQSDGPQNAAPSSWPTMAVITSTEVSDSSSQITADDLSITLLSETKEDEGNGWSRHEVSIGITNNTEFPLFLYGNGGTVFTNLDAEYPFSGVPFLYLPAKATIMGIWDYDWGTWSHYDLKFGYRIPSAAEPTEYEIKVFADTKPIDLLDLSGNIAKQGEIVYKIQPEMGQISPNKDIPVTETLPYEYTQGDGMVKIKVNSVDRAEGVINISLSITNLNQTGDSGYTLPIFDVLFVDGYWGEKSTIMTRSSGVTIPDTSAKVIGPGQTIDSVIAIDRDPVPEVGILIFMQVQDEITPNEIIVITP